MPFVFGPNVVIAGRFRLNRQLGRGGMGSVWHATHLGLDVPCAVKFIEGEIAALPEAQARFEREAKAAASLRSPNVVQVLDHGVYEGVPYIAMELLEGEDLGKRIARVGRLPAYEVVRIVMQVSRALTKAHAAGIVHRDLKPDNIYLVRDDEREIAKVLDFGIAKASGPMVSGSNTKTGAMLGTPYYMSPEQAQGTKTVDHRSDLWSLGVIVFQAITGRLPFESEALGDLLLQIIVSPVPMPSKYAPDLPPAFDRWWQKASERDPALRWQSSRELSEGLGIVFGLTPGASIIEAPGRASHPMGEASYPAGQQTGPGMQGAPMGTSPGLFAQTPPPGGMFGNTPGPYLGNTPNPMPHGATPNPQAMQMPHGATPHPQGFPVALGATPAVPTTGSQMYRTVGGAPPLPKNSRAGLFVALGGVGLLAVGLGVFGLFAMKGKGAHGAATATSSEVATATPTATVAPDPPAATPAATNAAGTPTADAASAAAIATVPATGQAAPQPSPARPVRPTWQGGGGPAPRPAPPAPAPAKPGKPKPVDLGI